MQRSTNCGVGYHQPISTLVGGTVTFPEEPASRCPPIPITDHFSCQSTHFEKPDDATIESIRAYHADDLKDRETNGCDVNKAVFTYSVNLMGTREVDYSGKKLSQVGMCSNCFQGGNDPNDGTHVVSASCAYVDPEHPMQAFDIDKNRYVPIIPSKRWNASLMTCSLMPDDEHQIIEDLQRVIAYNAEHHNGTAAHLRMDNPTENLVCDVSVVPWHM